MYLPSEELFVPTLRAIDVALTRSENRCGRARDQALERRLGHPHRSSQRFQELRWWMQIPVGQSAITRVSAARDKHFGELFPAGLLCGCQAPKPRPERLL